MFSEDSYPLFLESITFFNSDVDRRSSQHDSPVRPGRSGEGRSGRPRPEPDRGNGLRQPDQSVHQISSSVHGQFD